MMDAAPYALLVQLALRQLHAPAAMMVGASVGHRLRTRLETTTRATP